MIRTPAVALAALACGVLLAGCAAPSQHQVVQNQRLSDAVKARNYRSYKEVWVVPPRGASTALAQRIALEFITMGFSARVTDPTKPLDNPQGTGFVISNDGWMLTCAHVLGTEKVATVTLNGQRLLADVTHADAKVDLALLKLRTPLPAGAQALAFRAAARVGTMGEDVFTIGYPLNRLLGNSARMTRGLLSATAGLRDNQQELQVSAEIQPGNSGGPLLDKDGQIIGVVHKTINPAAVAAATGGALPQNINFAIKGGGVLDFVKAADAKAFAALHYDKPGALDQAGRGVARIQAGLAGPDSERSDKLVVVLRPVFGTVAGRSTQAMAITAIDFESSEARFTVVHSSLNVSQISSADQDTIAGLVRAAVAPR